MPVIDFHNHYYPPNYMKALQSGQSSVRVTVDSDGNPNLHYPGDYNVAVVRRRFPGRAMLSVGSCPSSSAEAGVPCWAMNQRLHTSSMRDFPSGRTASSESSKGGRRTRMATSKPSSTTSTRRFEGQDLAEPSLCL